ncbi:hypothetical protein GCM10007968_20920 [Sporolactobacillus putidus]|uniref:Uncharacterized protein n=1 Tax=Sporolactobacillus putidus TaxID=492735 RepID=A0A917W194_9BACL|nr:hypothetical protein GCM10007968_20920 [Sporolactobacillus putidus]
MPIVIVSLTDPLFEDDDEPQAVSKPIDNAKKEVSKYFKMRFPFETDPVCFILSLHILYFMCCFILLAVIRLHREVRHP